MGVNIKIESRGSDPGKAPRQDLPVMKDGMRDGFGTYTATVDGISTAFMVKGYDSEGRPHGAEAIVDGTKSAADNVPLLLAQMTAAANKPMLTFPPMVKLSGAEVQPNGTLLIRFIVEASISGDIPESKPKKKLKVINIGLQSFYESLKSQNTRVVQIRWKPPIKQSEEINNLLDKLL